MGRNEYFKNYYDVWYESLRVMKYHKDNNEPANEGIIFVKDDTDCL